MKKKIINIKAVVEWSDWHAWKTLKVPVKAKGGIRVPYKAQGVYEVRKEGSEKGTFNTSQVSPRMSESWEIPHIILMHLITILKFFIQKFLLEIRSNLLYSGA